MGMHHLGLATLDAEATRTFYEGVLKFRVAADDFIEIAEGGRVRHIMFDIGDGTLIAFMEPQEVASISRDFDPGINKGLGTPPALYHFAFNAYDEETLQAKRKLLFDANWKVTEIMPYSWARSIYFHDPNGLLLEYSYNTRPLTAEDAVLKSRYRATAANFAAGIDGAKREKADA